MSTSVREYLEENNPNAVNFDGLEEAIIGVGGQYTKGPLIIYSLKKIYACLMKQGMTAEGAAEFSSFNIEDLWAGEGTPIIMDDINCDVSLPSPVKIPIPTRKKRHDHAQSRVAGRVGAAER